MSDALRFTELDGQHVELLPARTVLSAFVQGTVGSKGADSFGGIGIAGIPILSMLFPGAGNAYGGAGANANGS